MTPASRPGERALTALIITVVVAAPLLVGGALAWTQIALSALCMACIVGCFAQLWRAREMKLPNFSMLPLQAGRDYRALLVDADLCFITQQAGAGNSFFPSKLLGLLAEAKPVVTVAAPECELALSLGEGGFGVNVPPRRAQELAELLDALAQDPPRLAEFGAAGRRYVEQFEKSRVLKNFADELQSLG